MSSGNGSTNITLTKSFDVWLMKMRDIRCAAWNAHSVGNPFKRFRTCSDVTLARKSHEPDHSSFQDVTRERPHSGQGWGVPDAMSYAAIKKAWESDVQSHTQRLVLAALASFTNDQHQCWPSIQTLSKRCHLAERNVQKQLRSLIRLGLVEMEKGGGRNSNTYRISGVSAEHPTPVTGAPHPRSPVTPGVSVEHPICNRTSIEKPWNGQEPPRAKARSGRLPAPEVGLSDSEKAKLRESNATFWAQLSKDLKDGNLK